MSVFIPNYHTAFINTNENASRRVSDENGEILCVEIITPNQKPLSVLLTYRPPSSNVSITINNIKSLVKQYQLLYLNSEYIWVGDLNIDLLKKDTLNARTLFNTASALNMKHLLNTPTRITDSSSSLMDIVFSNITYVSLVCPANWNMSDHLPTFLIKKKINTPNTNTTFTGRSYRDFDISIFEKEIKNKPL